MAERKTARTTSGVVQPTPGYYHGYVVTVAIATNPVTIYDNASAASGTVIDVIPTSTAAGAVHSFASPIKCDNGIYASFGGTGTVLFLHD